MVRNIDWLLQLARYVWDVVKDKIRLVFCPDPPSRTRLRQYETEAVTRPPSQGLDTTDLKTELRLWNFNVRPAYIGTTIPHVKRCADNGGHCATIQLGLPIFIHAICWPHERVSLIDEQMAKMATRSIAWLKIIFKQRRSPVCALEI